MPRCYRHSSRPAAALCMSCGRPVCGECSRFIGYRHYCPECAPAAPVAYPYPYPYPYPPAPRVPYSPPEPTDERERRWWRADWGLLEVFVAWLAIFGLYNVVGVILFLFTENPLLYNYIAYALIFCPLIALSVWLLPRRHGRSWKEMGMQWGDPPKTLAYGGLGALAALIMSYGTFFLIYLVFYLLTGRGPQAGEQEQLRELSGGYLVIVLVVVTLLAPVFEELFFRGLFYPALRRRMGPASAIVLNGVIFGVLHFQPLFILSLILVGIVLAFLYEKTDSLVAPMVAHSVYNLAVVAVSLYAGW